MKKFKDWFLQHESLIIKILLFTAIGLVFYFYIQALHKDHSLKEAMIKVEFIQEKNKAEQQIRQVYDSLIKQKDERIFTLMQRDSAFAENISNLQTDLDNLNKKQNEKIKVINSFGSNEFLDYLRNLPKYPDN